MSAFRDLTFSLYCSCGFRVGFLWSHRLGVAIDCKTVRMRFKKAQAVKQKVWNEAENRKRDWGETLKIRFGV